MSDFLKMDVFFAVTTVVAVVLGIFGAAVLWRLERVLKNIEHISEQVSIESDNIHQDLADLRASVRRGARMKGLFDFLSKFMKKTRKKS